MLGCKPSQGAGSCREGLLSAADRLMCCVHWLETQSASSPTPRPQAWRYPPNCTPSSMTTHVPIVTRHIAPILVITCLMITNGIGSKKHNTAEACGEGGRQYERWRGKWGGGARAAAVGSQSPKMKPSKTPTHPHTVAGATHKSHLLNVGHIVGCANKCCSAPEKGVDAGCIHNGVALSLLHRGSTEGNITSKLLDRQRLSSEGCLVNLRIATAGRGAGRGVSSYIGR